MSKLAKEELEKLANEISARTVTFLNQALQRYGGTGKRDNYSCTGLEFTCSTTYKCSAPDECVYNFSCPKSYTAAVRQETDRCHYDLYTCDTYKCDENFSCGLTFKCKVNFEG